MERVDVVAGRRCAPGDRDSRRLVVMWGRLNAERGEEAGEVGAGGAAWRAMGRWLADWRETEHGDRRW
jgi:hypothetical protein